MCFSYTTLSYEHACSQVVDSHFPDLDLPTAVIKKRSFILLEAEQALLERSSSMLPTTHGVVA